MIDFSRCPRPLWAHQQEGVRLLVQHPAYLLLDEVGVGKSAQLVTAACHLTEAREIDALLIVCPAFARSVWASPDPILGEFVKWVWPGTDYTITEYSARKAKLPAPAAGLQVLVTNYELARRENHRDALIRWAEARRTWLVLDESWAVKNPQAQQTKACYRIRQACARVTELNGTPGAPHDLFAQFQILDPAILNCKNWFHFRARYCVMGGWQNKKIVGYQRMEEFRARTKPYAIRRLAKDCLDLPPVLPPMTIEARLTERTWAVYKSMRDELVAWLDTDAAAVALQAGVRTLRLRQILAGFVGGVEDMGDPDLLTGAQGESTREVGREKLDAILEFTEAQDLQRVIVWALFRPEMARMAAEYRKAGKVVHLLQGQQPPEEREASKRAFAPGSTDPGDVMVGHPAAGGAGLNFARANWAIYTSQFGLKDRLQSEGRINRPGQTQPVRFVDVIAVGPAGQKTIDHALVAAYRANLDIATWTAENWRRALTEE